MEGGIVMDSGQFEIFEGIALVISAVGSLITAVGAIYIAARQMPQQAAKLAQVEKLANGQSDSLRDTRDEVARLHETATVLSAEALKKAEEALQKEQAGESREHRD